MSERESEGERERESERDRERESAGVFACGVCEEGVTQYFVANHMKLESLASIMGRQGFRS